MTTRHRRGGTLRCLAVLAALALAALALAACGGGSGSATGKGPVIDLQDLAEYSRTFDDHPEVCVRYWSRYRQNEPIERERLGNLSISVASFDVGHLDSDGTEDGALSFRCRTNGSSPPSGVLVFLSSKTEVIEILLEDVVPGLSYPSVAIIDEELRLESYEHRPSDGSCCPSLKATAVLTIRDGAAVVKSIDRRPRI